MPGTQSHGTASCSGGPNLGYCTTPRLYWWDVLTPYLKNTGVLKCPSAATADMASPNFASGTNYGFNIYSYSGTGWSRKITVITVPAETILISDRAAGCCRILAPQCVNTGCTCYGGARPVQNGHYLDARHMDGANYAFWDGHVKWFRTTVPSAANGYSADSPPRNLWGP